MAEGKEIQGRREGDRETEGREKRGADPGGERVQRDGGERKGPFSGGDNPLEILRR